MLSDLFYTFVYLNLVTVLMFIIMRKKIDKWHEKINSST